MKLLKVLLFIFAVLIFAIFSLDFNIFAPKLSEIISKEAAKHGYFAKFNQPKLSLLSFTSSKIQILIPRAASQIDLDNFVVNSSWLSLLSLNPTVNLSSKLFQGDLTTEAKYSILSSKGLANLALTSAKLESTPQLGFLGVLGDLAVQVKQIRFNSKGIIDGSIELKINNGKKIHSGKLNLSPVGLPFSLDLPAFSDLNLECIIELLPEELKSKQCKLMSSLIKASLELRFERKNQRELAYGEWELLIELSKQGLSSLGPYLPILSNSKIPSDTSRFAVTGLGSVDSQRISWRRR